MSEPVYEILTPEEAARFIKTSTATIRSMIASGKLRAVEIGGGTRRRHYRIAKKDLLALFGLDPKASHGEAGGASQGMSPGRTLPHQGHNRR